MATTGQHIGVVKRKAKSAAKRLVKEYLEEGLYENYGENEIRELKGMVSSIRGLTYQGQVRLTQDIRELIQYSTDILFARGGGNTRDVNIRKRLAYEAMSYINNYEWSTMDGRHY